jgi:hypothetical protein
MQVKDIPTLPILKFVDAKTRPHLPCLKYCDGKGLWCNWYFDNAHSVTHAMPPNLPDKLVLAKMRNLIKRGLLDGCPCGCRGDYVMTDKGRQYLLECEA